MLHLLFKRKQLKNEECYHKRAENINIIKRYLHINCRCDIIPMESIEAGNATKNNNEGADYWLKYFGELPEYYVTKNKAKSLGWRQGKSPSNYIPGKMIMGGVYHNKNGHLPDAPGRVWYEADINYYDGRRNRTSYHIYD